MPRKKLTNAEKAKSRKIRPDYSKKAALLNKYGFEAKSGTKRRDEKTKKLFREKGAYIKYLKEDRKVSPVIGLKGGKRPKRKGRIKTSRKSGLKYRFKFQRLTGSQLKRAKASGLFSSAQFSTTGIFIERPVGIKAKDYKVSFPRGGNVEITSDCRHDEIIALDAAMLADDPDKAIAYAIEHRNCRNKSGKQRNVKTFSLMVNGFRAQRSSNLGLKDFMFYLKNTLLPEWQEKNEGEPIEKFVDIFHIRLVY